MIVRPILPPKAGYVERVNTAGDHYYAPTDETLKRLAEEAKRVKQEEVSAAILGGSIELQAAEQFRRAVQLFAASLTDEVALEIATVYDAWSVGRAYNTGEYCTYGVNSVGDPQLYKVVQSHTSQADWTPDVTASLFSAVGLDNSGYPVWTQPTGAHDAYNKGDIVNYNGTLYESLIDGNTYSPEAYPAGWQEVAA